MPPLPGQWRIRGPWWGLSAEKHPLSSPLGQVWQQCPGSSMARGQAGTGQSCFMFLQFTFPTGFPRWFLCCRGPRRPQESRDKVCQAISSCVKSCPLGIAWLPPSFSIWSPGHLAQSPDACTAAKPGPPPHSPQPPDQLCVAPPAPASGSCSEGGREGGGRRPSPRRGRKNEA